VIHNVRNTDFVVAVDDEDCMDVLRLFNEPEGVSFLTGRGVPEAFASRLDLVGISGIGNIIAAVKFARYLELTESDAVFTILTDSMELYRARTAELAAERGPFSREEAAAVLRKSLHGQGLDNMAELGYYDRLRIHNLKYFTWIEQQGRQLGELNEQWYRKDYWTRVQALTPDIDALITAFNRDSGAAP